MTILLVDGNGLACRLWWADPYEVQQRFVRVVVATMGEQEAGIVIVAWDNPAPTWRRRVCETYKTNRKAKPEALMKALEGCRAIPVYEHLDAPGYEADDIIGTLKGLARADGHEVAIMSGDKDFAQLVDSGCWLVGFDGVVTGVVDVEIEYGVPPARFRHLLSWMGDASDGLPGMHGYGKIKSVPRALAGEIGDPMTYQLVGLATVSSVVAWWRKREVK